MWGKFLTFSSHWNFLPRTTCYISSHSLMWGKGFHSFPQLIFNFLTFWMCGIGCNEFPHTFPHSRPSRKIKRKIPYIFPMCGTLFSLHQFHTCGKFLTFSSLFPHIFLTLKFHSVEEHCFEVGLMVWQLKKDLTMTSWARGDGLFTLGAFVLVACVVAK